MSKDELDKLIAKNLTGGPSSEGIDIRKRTMARISSYENKKEKTRHVFHWVLSFLVGSGSLAAIVVYENLFIRCSHPQSTRRRYRNPATGGVSGPPSPTPR